VLVAAKGEVCVDAHVNYLLWDDFSHLLAVYTALKETVDIAVHLHL